MIDDRHITVSKNGQHDELEGLEWGPQGRDITAKGGTEGQDETNQHTHKDNDPRNEILLRNDDSLHEGGDIWDDIDILHCFEPGEDGIEGDQTLDP